MVEIDGSTGEGGGQVLRTAVTLSLLTREPVRIVNIRARRRRGGLQPQHLMAVQAAAAVGGATVEGDRLNSDMLVFTPGDVRPGRYQFDIGTAGSVTLVAQTIFLPLSRAEAASSVTVIGGTHVPHSPTYHYLEMQWLPLMRLAVYDGRATMEQAGFYPRGGGRMHLAVRPSPNVKPLQLVGRGELRRLSGVSAVANLPVSIAERQRLQATEGLKHAGQRGVIELVQLQAYSPGTLLLLLAEYSRGRACYQSLGERGKPAERVADEAVSALEHFLPTNATVDEYAADQIMLPLALAPGPSEYRTPRVTQHLLTNAEIISRFLPATIEIQGDEGGPGTVRITP